MEDFIIAVLLFLGFAGVRYMVKDAVTEALDEYYKDKKSKP